MAKLIWAHSAQRDFIRLTDYIEQENPAAAALVVERIENAARRLCTFPMQGRLGGVMNTRELVVTGAPYVLVYSTGDAEVRVLRILHQAQAWPQEGL